MNLIENCLLFLCIENEGKINAQTGDHSVRAGYSDVYDWRPSVEKTDVMRTMEAIEGIVSPTNILLIHQVMIYIVIKSL